MRAGEQERGGARGPTTHNRVLQRPTAFSLNPALNFKVLPLEVVPVFLLTLVMFYQSQLRQSDLKRNIKFGRTY